MRKIIALGIMLLFLGMTISSTTGFNLDKQSTIALFGGNTLYVGGSGSGNYTKIQDAIDDTSDGDTVFVYNGFYFEKLLIRKSIRLIGENRETTKLIGPICTAIIEICNDAVLIEGFNLTSNHGSAIIVHDYDNILINDNIFYDIVGKGLWFDNVVNCKISNNIFSNIEREGIFLYKGLNVTFDGNLFSNTQVGVHIESVPKWSFINNHVINNSIGLWVKDTYYIISLISNNSFFNNGVGISLSDSLCDISYNNISNNEYLGIYLENCIYNEIFNNFIFENEIGIRLENSRYIIISSNTMMNNKGNRPLRLPIDGIELKWNCYHNKITFNNFIDDDIGFNVFFPRSNKIRHNYYTKWSNNLPKPIIGFKLLEFRKIPFLIYSIPFPWIILDLLPASEPYDIGV